MDESEERLKVAKTKKIALSERQILLCCGTGGVGKTTISVALAIAGARSGKKVALITIDPARRLASAMGLERLQSDPVDVSSHLGLKKGEGKVAAMIFEPEATLSAFILEQGGKELLRSFTQNRVYQLLASAFSGAHEYLALEKLSSLAQANYDLIVLDTPPARHTLDFLDATDRLERFFDDRIFRWFRTDIATENSWLDKLRARGTKIAFQTLERVTGGTVLADFARLAPELARLKEGFLERQRNLQKLLRSRATGLVLISTAAALESAEFAAFLTDAKKRELDPALVVLNRSVSHLISPSPPRQKPDWYLALEQEFALESRAINEALRVAKQQIPFTTLPDLGQNIGPEESLRYLASELDASYRDNERMR